MGIILCEKHGRQGFYIYCEHIDAEFKRDIYHEYRHSALSGMPGIIVCDECWKTHDLDRFREFEEMPLDDFSALADETVKSVEDEWNKAYNSINTHPWCNECVAEVIIKDARRKNETLPFRIFERTLTQNQSETIEELEEKLKDNFNFEKSVFWKTQFQDRASIFVRAGAFSYPLQIQIYYIIDENKQNEIIRFVEDFLQDAELNQAKVEFWEVENWIATENRFGLNNYHRGEEKLLREVFLNC